MTIILTPTFTPTVSTMAFADMVPDLSAFLPGCPSLVIERTIRKIATDLCQRAKPWTLDMVPITLVPAQTEYDLTSPASYAEPTDVVEAFILFPDGTKVDLEWLSYAAVRRAYPSWPQDSEGQPKYLTSSEVGKVLLAPVPEATGDLYIRAVVRPTATATVWEQWLYDEFKRAVFHGTLHELMLMPERSWFNEKTGMYHGKQWTFLLSAARDRAQRGYNVDSIGVEMRPFA
jgi:hypothetical protein